MSGVSRREFMKKTSLNVAGAGFGLAAQNAFAQEAGERPAGMPSSVEVLNPKNRVPMSLIIDDSTCLVNMAYYGIPQFGTVFPEKYTQPWRTLPQEIPDSFVRKFGEWCHDHSIKGKYSIVPYPACTGWVDRHIPGWTKKELEDSLDLVRTLMVPDWDIHPEMISHTIVIDTKTGRPAVDWVEANMENWGFTPGKSADQLADYLAYALKILKNAGLPCEGITTPGGFGTGALPELSQATLESCRDVFNAEIPHYFRHLFTDDTSVMPRVEYASGLDGSDPRCVVSIVGCTGDWFGGWDGLNPGSPDKFITSDLKSGRLVEVIEKGEPAIIVCHWPGVYYNGEEIGFDIFKEVVKRVHSVYDNLFWMKLSEIARYWAARELTTIRQEGKGLSFNAPFASPWFTVGLPVQKGQPEITAGSGTVRLKEVNSPLALENGTFCRDNNRIIVCFDLSKGSSSLRFA